MSLELTWRPRAAGILAVSLGLTIAAILVAAAETPRARMNVMQVVYAVFVTILVVRFARSRSAAPPSVLETPSGWVLWLAMIASVAAWLPMLGCGFISDDFAHLYTAKGPILDQLWSLFRYGQASVFLRPMGFASIFLDHAAWGDSPFGYHLTNLLIHLTSSAGIYALVRNLGVERAASLTTTALFTAMPIQVEAVAWMGARFDLLATVFTVWAAVSYLRFRVTRNVMMFGITALLYTFAMLSKESGFVLPLLLTAIELFVFRSLLNWAVAGLMGLGALVFGYRLFALGGIGGYAGQGTAAAVEIGPKTLEGLLLRGPSQLFLGLNWLQPHAWTVIAIACGIATLLVLLAIFSRIDADFRRLVKLGFAWMFVAMLPPHFLLMVGSGLTNSRVIYLASVGGAIVLGQFLRGLPSRRFREAGSLAFAVLLASGVVHNIGAWRWTAQLSSDMLAEVVRLRPSPPPSAEFVFEDLPDTVRGVFFFHVALTEGLRLKYQRDDIVARLAGSDEPVAPTSLRFAWKGIPGALLESRDH